MTRTIFKWCVSNHQWLLSGVAIIMILLNLQLYIKNKDDYENARYCDRIKKFYFENDEYVRRSAKIWSEYAKEPIDLVERESYPSVVYKNDEVCVSFFPFGLGGTPNYCFDKTSKMLTFIDQEVE